MEAFRVSPDRPSSVKPSSTYRGRLHDFWCRPDGLPDRPGGRPGSRWGKDGARWRAAVPLGGKRPEPPNPGSRTSASPPPCGVHCFEVIWKSSTKYDIQSQDIVQPGWIFGVSTS